MHTLPTLVTFLEHFFEVHWKPKMKFNHRRVQGNGQGVRKFYLEARGYRVYVKDVGRRVTEFTIEIVDVPQRATTRIAR